MSTSEEIARLVQVKVMEIQPSSSESSVTYEVDQWGCYTGPQVINFETLYPGSILEQSIIRALNGDDGITTRPLYRNPPPIPMEDVD